MRKYLLIAIAVTTIVAAIWLVMAVSHLQAEAVRMRCYGRMSYLRAALANYEVEHSTLPTLNFTNRSDAVRLHWLVSLLPYIERSELHDPLDLEANWESPANLRVVGKDSGFQNLFFEDGYQVCALRGDKSIWDPESGAPKGKLAELPNTILLVAIPVSETVTYLPVAVTNEELLTQSASGRKILFIQSDGRYGQANKLHGVIEFPLP